MKAHLARLSRWLRDRPPLQWRIAYRWLGLVACVFPALMLVSLISEIRAIPGPGALPAPDENTRFGLDEPTRKDLFREIARHETGWRTRAKKHFPNHEWSQEDDYHNNLRLHVHYLARMRKLNFTQVFMVYDEGVHEQWPGPKGTPMSGKTLPLQPRTE